MSRTSSHIFADRLPDSQKERTQSQLLHDYHQSRRAQAARRHLAQHVLNVHQAGQFRANPTFRYTREILVDHRRQPLPIGRGKFPRHTHNPAQYT